MGVLMFRIRNRIRGSIMEKMNETNEMKLHHLLADVFQAFVLLGIGERILAAICHSTYACTDILAEN